MSEKKHHLVFFFAAWFLLNVVQAYHTELIDDEAYYWVYSRFLDWGYFDHPPAIALLIRGGYALFQNELGVRILTLTLSTFTLVITYRLLQNRNDKLFFTLALSLALLQVGGIIAVPDLPLCFFTALFFLLYKQFLIRTSLQNSLLLGVVMAAMLYSKYHGILIIIFTLGSNPKLAVQPHAYLAAVTGVLLFLPHLYWQYTHGFPSVKYHLFERNEAGYDIIFSIEYIIGQVLIVGPFLGWLFIWSAFKFRYTDLFHKALKFCLVGFYLFFLACTFKGRVEANWTSPIITCLIVLSHQYLYMHVRLQRIVNTFLPITLLVVLAIRIYMMSDILPSACLSQNEIHKNREWVKSLYDRAGGSPAIFINSYQKASKYWFYAGVPSFSLNSPSYRRNNFNFWPVEDSLKGKKVVVFSTDPYVNFTDSVITENVATGVQAIDSFFSFSKLNIASERNLKVINGTLKCKLTVVSPENHLNNFHLSGTRFISIELAVVEKNRVIALFPTNIKLSILEKTEQTVFATFPVALSHGRYEASFCLPTAVAGVPSMNSNPVTLVVE